MDFNVTDFNVRLRTIRLREFAVVLVISFILTLFVAVLFPIMDTYDDLLIFSLIFFLLVFFVYALRGTTGLSRDFNALFEENNAKEILYVFAINLFFAFIFSSFFAVSDIVLTLVDPSWIPTLDFTPSAVDPVVYTLEFISSVFLAPVIEELCFRGVLFNRVKIRIGILPAMILTSILFALGHEFGGMTSAFVFGMCMCVLYLKTDNILVPMSVHFLNNLCVSILDIFHMESLFYGMPGAFIIFILALISMFLIIIYLYKEIKALSANS
mgnify:CR=1 FL=1